MTTVGNRSGHEIRYVCYEPLSALKCPPSSCSFCGGYAGAGRGSRTPKTRRSADFESAASASSAIAALLEVLDSTAYFTFPIFFIQDSECETVQVNVKGFMDFHRSLRRP